MLGKSQIEMFVRVSRSTAMHMHTIVPAHLLAVAGMAVVTVVCNALIFFFMVQYVPIQHNITIPSSTVGTATNAIRIFLIGLHDAHDCSGGISMQLLVQFSSISPVV